MSLLTHVRKGDWTSLEDEWTELMLGDASIGPAIEAIPHAARRREMQRIVPFVREHAEILENNERAAEAAALLGEAMVAGGSPGELSAPLYTCAHAAWGSERWFEPFAELTGFVETAPDMRAAWRNFKKLVAIKEADAVYHGSGWGIGKIEDKDLGAMEIKVRFTSGRSDRFPLSTALDIFEPLAPEDPRTLVVTDPERLEKMIKKEPLELLRKVLRRQGGQANQAQLKIAMAHLGLEGPKYTAFWRKARKEADASPWFEVSGAGTKVQVKILDTEADPAESARRQILRSADLRSALARVREIFSGGQVDPALHEAALSALEELAEEDTGPRERRVSVWMFLREERGETPEALRRMLQEALEEPDEPGGRPALWAIFAELPGSRDQERCIELLREVRGDAWLDDAARCLGIAAPGMARGLVEALDEAGRRSELVEHYAALLIRPTATPNVFAVLADRIEDGEHHDGLVGPVQRLHALVQLSVFLKRQPASDAFATRARARLTGLLTRGKPPLFLKLLRQTTTEDLRRLNPVIERGLDRELDRLFTAHVVETAPEIFKGAERPFWDSDVIWTTRAGLSKVEEELRVLRDIKIPENSEAIGKAAALGDLSENSEWESAIEEQRNLTNRATELQADVRAAQLLEDAAIPESTVAPGTRVTIRVDGEQRTVSLLGPWDTEEAKEDVLSYRAPLAAGILGLGPGGSAKIKLPTGVVTVEVVDVELLPL